MKKQNKRKVLSKARKVGSNERTSSQIPPGTRFVSQEVVDHLMKGLLHSLEERNQVLEIGDLVEATFRDGYTVKALVIPPSGLSNDIPFSLQITISDPDGHFVAWPGSQFGTPPLPLGERNTPREELKSSAHQSSADEEDGPPGQG
jgi:hypothetical protein